MSFTFRQFLSILLCCLLLVQVAGAAILPQHVSESEQSSQLMQDEEMTESHDCCDEQVKACCEGCEQGCQCVPVSAYLIAPELAFNHITLLSSPVLFNIYTYLFQSKDLPERPPRA